MLRRLIGGGPDMDWPTFWGAALGSSAGGSILGIAIKSLIDRSLDRNRSELQAQREQDLERLKALLSAGNVERQIRFAKVWDQQLEFLLGFSAKLRELQREVTLEERPLSLTLEEVRARHTRAHDLLHDAARYFRSRQVLLPPDLASAVDIALLHMSVEWAAVYSALEAIDAENGEGVEEEVGRVAISAFSEVNSTLQRVEAEFRALLATGPRTDWPPPA